MTQQNRTGRINVKLLILLGVVFATAAAGVVIAHTVRKRMIASRALAAGQAAYQAKNWETAAQELRTYLNKFPNDNEVLMQFAQAELNIRPVRAAAISSASFAYRKVLNSRKGDKDLCERLCRLYYLAGDYTETLYVAQQRLVAAPDGCIRHRLARTRP